MNNLLPGDQVELRAYSLDGKLILTRLERDDFDANDRTRVQGPVTEKSGNSLTVSGITLLVDNDTEFEDANDQPLFISQTDFFALVELSDVVKAEWRDFTATSVPVDKLSIEID